MLKEIGIEEKDALLVLNKSDVARQMPHFNSLLNRYPNAIAVSAMTAEGFDRLHTVVGDALSRSFQDVDIEMSVGNGKLLAYLAAKGEIVSTQYREDVVLVHCRIPQKYLGRIDYDVTIVTPHNAAGWIDEKDSKSAADEAETLTEFVKPAESEPPVEPEATESENPLPPASVDMPINPIEAPRD